MALEQSEFIKLMRDWIIELRSKDYLKKHEQVLRKLIGKIETYKIDIEKLQ